MFDFNTLFNQVFPLEDGIFDPRRNYYTVLVNCVGQAPYYANYNNQRRIHMGDAYYRELDVSNGADKDAFRSTVMSIGQEFAVKVDTAYVFLMDFEKDTYETAFFRDYLQIVREFKQTGDTVAIVAMLPELPSDCNEILEKLEEDILETEVLHLYNKLPYREGLLSDALCGAVLLHSSRQEYAALRTGEQQLMQTVHNAIAGLPPAGAQAVREHKPLLWSGLGCAFSNPKMDHLRGYVAYMCDKVKGLTEEEFKQLCGKLYPERLDDIEKRNLHNLLSATVDRIPLVRKDLPKYDNYTLVAYFREMFGDRGKEVVDLSFKVTLSMIRNAAGETAVINTANMLVEQAAAYHSEDLYGELCAFMQNYCAYLSYEADAATRKMNEESIGNGDYREDLRGYIGKYLAYYQLQRKRDFWNSVDTYIKNHKASYAAHWDHAKELSRAIAQLKRDLQLRRAVPFSADAVRSYAAHEILNAANDPSICAEMAALYTPPETTVMSEDTVDMNFLFKFVPAPGFNNELSYRFATGNGGYAACITQYIGKYLHFLQVRKA